ncbi:lipopolysaccharide biosynthesis protein [Citrobacter sp. S2-9]|uniref:Lipopolysaccharide biosynthesis protein n=1 Tax=Citrobacter enshiensis TaxID=2971264 RepID=A0ABT8PU72_9ENTR|nr:lipopolysaccharide biosynthesis protein [Citrobacter enshiensis]MDN8599598.1 lipopolysaccharide biosynthesis protein [Citrobacter enshiensis]
MSDLKSKTVNGLKWSAFERIFSQGIQFILILILAKFLGPKAFGLIGMVAIFIAIGQVLVDSGFSSALIRKVDRTDVDYSTALYFNVSVSVVFYFFLYACAPYIAKFYEQPELELLTRVIGLSLVVNSFCVVPRTILTVEMNFKALAKSSITSVVIGGCVALVLAYNKCGVWALVGQTLVIAICNAIFINVIVKWIPPAKFDRKSFNYLFGFGGRLLISGILDTVYNNIYQIIIGKKFSAFFVGQYTQANQISSIPAMTMTSIIQRVTYPMFCHMQHDINKMEEYYLLTMKVASLFIFPIMAGIAIIAKPSIALLLGEQWSEAAKLIVILSLAYMIYPIHAINLNILQVKGRSDLFLKVEIIKKMLGVIIVAVTMRYGIMAMCIGLLIHSYISLLINIIYTAKLTTLGIWKQLVEISPIWLTAIFSCFIAWGCAIYFTANNFYQIVIMLVEAPTIYFALVFLTQRKIVSLVLSIRK